MPEVTVKTLTPASASVGVQPPRQLQELNLKKLTDALAGSAAAFRCRSRLQPAGGPGAKVFPPTYAGAVYAVEQRRVPGRSDPVTCVLLDSVQSQANRMEEALQDAVDDDRLALPLLVVDFSPFFPGEDRPEDMRLLDPIHRVTSLQAPHRLADAILRDSLLEGTPFRRSKVGKEIDGASAQNATPLFRLCPTALIFGMWDSTGPKGGLGAKFERAMVSEIVGVGCCYRYDGSERTPRNVGIRRDPLNVSKMVGVRKTDDGWDLADESDGAVVRRPSEINHSNVPFGGDNAGITIDYAEQTAVLSLAALRRLRFPADGRWQPSKEHRDRDTAARTVLAALALCAAELAAEKGLDLRSRCLLWADGPREWELLDAPGQEPVRFSIGAAAALNLLKAAVSEADRQDVNWYSEPITLQPSDKLVKLVRRSQELAATEGGGEEAN
jgi:CRISPR-associated protein Csb1